jgi:hypothetical protein
MVCEFYNNNFYYQPPYVEIEAKVFYYYHIIFGLVKETVLNFL